MKQWLAGCLTTHSGFGPCTHAADDAGRGNPTCCQSQALGDKAQSREDSTTVLQKERERERGGCMQCKRPHKKLKGAALLFLLASW
jgi:hypothetical protein